MNIKKINKTIKEILSSKGALFNRIDGSESLTKAILLFKTDNISYLIVEDKKKNFLGLITYKDIINKVDIFKEKSSYLLVKDFLNTELPILDINFDTEKYCKAIDNHKINYIIVYDKNKFIGVITIHDLFRALIY